MSTSTTCGVCCDTFNKRDRQEIKCGKCDFNACRKCVRTYLLGSNDVPHCMSCKNQWGRDIYTPNILPSFVNGEYKEHRKNVLFEEQLARLQDTMPAVERHIECIKLEQDAEEINDEIRKLCSAVSKKTMERNLINEQINRLKHGGDAKENKVFIKSCPTEGCRGFLSKQWKCELCGNHTCSKCFALKQKDAEGNIIPHECKKEDVESAELIKKETKNCPNCGTNIYKITGCDQMYCTQCRTPFSWKTGLKVNGVIHNPHYYEMQNAGAGGPPINNPGAVMCGGLPHFWTYRTNILKSFNLPSGSIHKKDKDCNDDEKTAKTLINLHRRIAHFAHVELDGVREKCNNINDNEDLRIKYILKEIDDSEMKTTLIKRDKMYEKAAGILQIYEFINTVFTESIRDISEAFDDDSKTIAEYRNIALTNLKRCNHWRKYSNKELAKISALYSQSVHIITKDFYTESYKFTRTNLAKYIAQ